MVRLTYADMVVAVKAAARRGAVVPFAWGGAAYQLASEKRGSAWFTDVIDGAGLVAWSVRLDGEPSAS